MNLPQPAPVHARILVDRRKKEHEFTPVVVTHLGRKYLDEPFTDVRWVDERFEIADADILMVIGKVI